METALWLFSGPHHLQVQSVCAVRVRLRQAKSALAHGTLFCLLPQLHLALYSLHVSVEGGALFAILWQVLYSFTCNAAVLLCMICTEVSIDL